jgi:type VI secretion system protein VasJ
MSIDDVLAASKERLSALLEPIGGGVGADVTYDEQFEAIKNEVDKLQSIEQVKVDWGSISSGADEILSDKSKDFRAALYYAAAKAQLDGLRGALDGVVLLLELTLAFWEPMYPPLKRPRARANLASWYGEVTSAKLGTLSLVAKDYDTVAALEKVASQLDGELRDRLADNFGGLGGLREAARRLLSVCPKEAPPPPPPPPPPLPPPKPEPAAAAPAAAPADYAPQAVVEYAPQADAAPAGGGISPDSIDSADAANAALGDVAMLLARCGDVLRVADATSPMGYHLLRTAAWLQLVAPPPDDGGRTMVPAPPYYLKDQLESLVNAGAWGDLVGAADAATAAAPLWLDSQRYLAAAFDNLGEEFANAKQTVLREVAFLLSRAPKIAELSFDDGTPFADDATKAWLTGEVAGAFGAGGGGGGGGGGGARPLDRALKDAREALAEGQVERAVNVVAKAARAATSMADRFRGRLELAKICLRANQFALAKAQLDGLDRLVDKHRLAEWEPELCADLFAALYEAHRAVNAQSMEGVTPEARAKEVSAFERLCEIDPAAALRLTFVAQ